MLRSLAEADALVVAQEGSLPAVPAEHRGKTTVVPKSVDLPLEPLPAPGGPVSHAVVLSHLRGQKDPFLAEEALRLLPASAGLEIHHYGAEAAPGFASEACARTAANPRYIWHGGVDREEAVAALAASGLLVNTSWMEGGSNAVAEAVALHLPVLATDVPGNTGILGADHPGLFPAGDAVALSRLLARCTAGSAYPRALASASAARAPRFTRDAEREGWQRVFASLKIR